MQEITQVATGGMSTPAFFGLIAALVTVITTLGEVIKTQYQKRTNPLNGTLSKLDATLQRVDTTLTKVELRTADSDRVLEGHTEKLVMLGATLAQLASNESRQTEALMNIRSSFETSLTGCAARITDHCNDRSASILKALDNG